MIPEVNMSMDPTKKTTVTLSLLLTVSLLQPSYCSRDQITEHNELYDTVVQMNCSNLEFQPNVEKGVSYQWILPTGVVVSQQPLPQNVNLSDDVINQITLMDEGSRLQINKLDTVDFGLYICLILRHDNASGLVEICHVIRHGVNLDGPYYGDQLSKYQPHIQRGLLAGTAVLVIMALICCNLEHASIHYDRKLRRKQEARLNLQHSNHLVEPVNYHNRGFEMDGGIISEYHNPFDEEMKERPPTKL